MSIRVAFIVTFCACAQAEKVLHLFPSNTPQTVLDSEINSFSSFQSLRTELRGIKTKTKVMVHPGRYAPFEFDEQDSRIVGQSDVEFIGIKDKQGDPPVVYGGFDIPTSSFKPDPTRPNVLMTDLKALGLNNTAVSLLNVSLGDCAPKSDLYFSVGGQMQRMVLARYPNKPIGSKAAWAYEHAVTVENGTTFTVSANLTARLENWIAKEPYPVVQGFWSWDWRDTQAVLVKGPSAGTFSTNPPQTLKTEARFVGINLNSELDMPGEYYIDAATLTLYFYAPVPPSQWKSPPVLSIHENCMSLNNVSGMNFASMNYSFSTSAAINAFDIDGVTFSAVAVFGTGESGIYMTGLNGKIEESVVFDTGCTGISLMGGDVDSHTPGKHMAIGNTVFGNAQRTRTYQPGIEWGGVGNYYAHNTVTDSPHNCFLGGGNEARAMECTFEYNVIQRCAFETSDVGAFYTCGQQASAWVNRGHIFRHNSFSDIRNEGPPDGTGVQGATVQALYLDDQMSGWTIYNNTFTNCQRGILLGGGRVNQIHNNSFKDCDEAISFDNRGLNWQLSSCKCTQPACKDDSGSCECNPSASKYVLTTTAGSYYDTTYPDLRNSTVPEGRPCTPVGNKIVDNTYCNTTGFCTMTAAQAAEYDSIIANNVNQC
eukprot:m.343007 g.343007  ORF g.343007 m.343007 type:complete len:652 (-) comp22208_c0_seq1:127-2082(-)